MSKAAIQGDYTDLRFVKGRKVAQIVVEIPIEAAGAFVEVFGTPLPDRTVPVALARLQSDLKEQLRESVEQERPKRNWDDLLRVTQAGIACEEPRFWTFLQETYGDIIDDGEDAAAVVRSICGVTSRKSFDIVPAAGQAWSNLYSNYRVWLKVPA